MVMRLHKPTGLTSLDLPVHTPFLALTPSPLTFHLSMLVMVISSYQLDQATMCTKLTSFQVYL